MMMTEDVIQNEPAGEPQTQNAAPKVLLKQTTRARKTKKAPPSFTIGELLPWKGVWFRLVDMGKDANERPLLVLQPQVEIAEDDSDDRSSLDSKKSGDSKRLSRIQEGKDLRRAIEAAEEVLDQQTEALPNSEDGLDSAKGGSSIEKVG